MGNTNSQTTNAEVYSVLKPLKWQKQHWLSNTQLVRNVQGNLKGEMHSIPIDNVQSEIPIYQFRKDNPQYLVTVYSVEEARQQILCAGGDFVKVVTQRIPFRLSDLGNVGYAEGLYILECVLKGARLIDERYLSACKGPKLEQCSQYVHYTDDMVCFTEAGQAKIWVSQNLASNHPTQIPFQNFRMPKEQNILQTFNIQKKIVYQLFNLIQSRMSGNKFMNYLQVKKEQEQELIDFENCIDFILRVRAIEQGENEAVNHIILPSMLVKSMPSNSQYQSYTNRSENNDENSNYARFGEPTNMFTHRNRAEGGYGTMESSASSTNSIYNQDINKFALPPRPPRKNSKSGSKDKSSRNGSPSKPFTKPSIPQPTNNTTTPHYNQPQSFPSPHKQQTLQVNNINSVISPAANPRSVPSMVKKQSLSSHARSPFQQMTQPTPAISINGIQQSSPTYQPGQAQRMGSPKNVGQQNQVPLNTIQPKQEGTSQPNMTQLHKKYSNNSNNSNTNTTISQPTYYPIQSSINNTKLTSIPASTHNSPPHSNFKPIITFNTNTYAQPHWRPTPLLNKQTNIEVKAVTPNKLTTTDSSNNITPKLTKQQSSNSTNTNITNTNSNINNNNINNNMSSTAGELHKNYNTKYANTNITTRTNIAANTPVNNNTYNQYMGQYHQQNYLGYRNQHIPTNKISITFNNSTVPAYTPTPYQYNPYINQPNTNPSYTPIQSYYTPPHNPQILTKYNQAESNSISNKYITSQQPSNYQNIHNNNTNTNTNRNRSTDKISLKVSRTNIDTSTKPTLKLDGPMHKMQAQYNKTIDERVYNVLNRQLLADSLLTNKPSTHAKAGSPTKNNNITHTTLNTNNNPSNISQNTAQLGISKSTHSQIEGTIQQI